MNFTTNIPNENAKTLIFVRCAVLIFALKISDEVREFAKQKGMDSEEAIEAGMKDKAKEFIDKGGKYIPGSFMKLTSTMRSMKF